MPVTCGTKTTFAPHKFKKRAMEINPSNDMNPKASSSHNTGMARPKKANKRGIGRTKKDRKALYMSERPTKAAAKPAENWQVLKLSDRESNGLMPVKQEHIRTYLSATYSLQYGEPPKEDWPHVVQDLHEETGADRRTIRSVFEGILLKNDIDTASSRKTDSK